MSLEPYYKRLSLERKPQQTVMSTLLGHIRTIYLTTVPWLNSDDPVKMHVPLCELGDEITEFTVLTYDRRLLYGVTCERCRVEAVSSEGRLIAHGRPNARITYVSATGV